MESDWTHSPWQPTIVFDEEDDTVKRYIDGHTNYSKPRRNVSITEYSVCRYADEVNKGKAVEHLISNIKACTQALTCSPYSASLWLDRGKCLLKLQYPELAVGDAYKATLLIKHFRDSESKIASHVGVEIARDLDLTWLLNSDCSCLDLLSSYSTEILERSHDLERRSLTLLTQALLCTHSFLEASEVFQSILGARQADSQLEVLRTTIVMAWSNQSVLWQADGMSAEEIEKDEKSGAVYVRRYPWMSSALSTRSSQVILQANNSIRRNSGPTCFVGKSKIRGKETDVLGMFAQIRLPAGMRFLCDITNLCAVENSTKACSTCCMTLSGGRFPILTRCCGMRFCSVTCWERADVYHRLQCGRDLKGFENARACPLVSAEKAADDRVLLRILATVIGDNAPHPLRSVVLGALTASYDRENAERFSLATDIVRPIDMLTRLGVDIFTNQTYDTWVIMTILTRIRNNSRESHVNGRHLIAINPLFSFFNHSCDPNVVDDTNDNDSSSTLTMRTTRRVKANKELFISYLHEDSLDLPREERNQLLRQWIGRDCACTRCLNEMAMEV